MKNNQLPFIHKFKTEKTHYIYDCNTNNILFVDPVMYDVVDYVWSTSSDEIIKLFKGKYTEEQVLTAIKDVEDAAEKLNVFSPIRPSTVKAGYTDNDIQEGIQNLQRNVILNITEKCNNRCKYCIYTLGMKGRREHTPKIMSWKIAKRGIDYAVEHSKKQKNNPVNISFYGGEPLLAFDLIKKCVEYAHKRFGKRNHSFSMTTNGTLFDDEKIDFLYKHKFGLLISLDGPKEIHDRYRISSSGEGTFDTIMAHLEKIKNKYPDYYNTNVMFSSVIVPPINLLDLDKFFTPLGKNIRIGTVDVWGSEKIFNIKDKGNYGVQELFDKFKRDIFSNNYSGKSNIYRNVGLPFAYYYFIDPYRRLKKRPLIDKPKRTVKKYCCCIPGANMRLFVDTDGTLYPCEKIDGNKHLVIGDIWHGVDIKRVRNLFKEFYEFIEDKCRNCWIINLCSMCFVHPTYNNKYDKNKLEYICNLNRKQFEAILPEYFSILEKDNDAFDFIDQEKTSDTTIPSLDRRMAKLKREFQGPDEPDFP